MGSKTAVTLAEVERLLAQALQLLDHHGIGGAAAPHIDLGLHQIRDELAALHTAGHQIVASRSAG